MARYIDADKFIAELEQEKNAALEFEDGVAAYEIEHTMNLIGMQPTADVVPKSEVEKIFAEIEKIIQKNYENAQNNEEDEELEAATDYLSYVSYDLDELKKKYTEQKND